MSSPRRRRRTRAYFTDYASYIWKLLGPLRNQIFLGAGLLAALAALFRRGPLRILAVVGIDPRSADAPLGSAVRALPPGSPRDRAVPPGGRARRRRRPRPRELDRPPQAGAAFPVLLRRARRSPCARSASGRPAISSTRARCSPTPTTAGPSCGRRRTRRPTRSS